MDILVTSISCLLFTWLLQAFSQLNELSAIRLSAPLATAEQKADFMEQTTVSSFS